MSPPTDPGLTNLDRMAKAAEKGELRFDERFFWENRTPGAPVIVFEGAELWKKGPIAAGELVKCPGCEVPGAHYHARSDEPKERR